MRDFQFKIGQRVYYSPKKSLGTVVEIVNETDAIDRMLQGTRYVVRLDNRVCWSVLERFLVSKETYTEMKDETAIAS